MTGMDEEPQIIGHIDLSGWGEVGRLSAWSDIGIMQPGALDETEDSGQRWDSAIHFEPGTVVATYTGPIDPAAAKILLGIGSWRWLTMRARIRRALRVNGVLAVSLRRRTCAWCGRKVRVTVYSPTAAFIPRYPGSRPHGHSCVRCTRGMRSVERHWLR